MEQTQSKTLNSQLLAEQALCRFPVGTNMIEGLIVEANGRVQSLGYTSNTNLPRFSIFNCENGLAHIPNRSTFWYQYTEYGSLKLTWQNVYFECNTNCPVSVQAEFYANGDFSYRYDVSSLTNVVGLQASGIGLQGTNLMQGSTTENTENTENSALPVFMKITVIA